MILEINMMLVYAIILLVICVVIGFFGDRYINNKKELNKALNEKKDDSKTEEVLAEKDNLNSKNEINNEGQSDASNTNDFKSNTTINSNSNNVINNQDDNINNMF